MLERLRQSVAGSLAKILIGLLVVSFSLWGIGDVFSSNPNPVIAEIGSKDISVKQFRRVFDQSFYQLQLNAREQGESISVAQARAAGLDRQILSVLMGQAVLAQGAENIGLTIATDELVKQIQADDAFQGAFGQFDKFNFQSTLEALGFTEEEYLAERKSGLIREQLITIFTARPPAPKQLVQRIYNAQNERRVAKYVVMKASEIPTPKTPNDEVLNEFILSQSAAFTAPEKRKFALMALDFKKFTATINISKQKLRKEYQARINEFKTDEGRLVQQIIFTNKKAAQRGKKKSISKRDFIKLAKKRGLSKDDISLGWIRKGDYLSPAIEKAVFRLSKGKISKPLETALGWVLVRVEDIRPAQQKTFNQVRAQLKQRLLYNLAQDEIDELHDLIEDEIASGETLTSVAKKYRLNLVKSKLLKRGDDLPKININVKGLGERIWAAQQEEVLPAAQTDGGGYYWLAITEIRSARVQNFKEVKTKAIKLWQQEEKLKLLKIRAENISKQVASGAKFSNIVKQKLRRTPPLARTANDKTLTPELIEAMFRTPKFGVFNGAAKTYGEIIVAQISSINILKDNAKNRKELLARIKQEMVELSANETLVQYLSHAQKEFGASIFENNLELAFEQTAP